MVQLHHELMVEILTRLPVKSLFRFRCLSKSFRALIDSSDFIKSHLSKSSQNSNLRELIFSDLSSMKFHIFDVNLDLEEDILLLEKSFSSLWKHVGGYCNGLFLVYRDKSFGLALWNPSTRQSRDLPDCPFQVADNVESYDIVASGFGYGDSVDDYKAVLIIAFEISIGIEIQIWIYELKSNIWRVSQNFPYPNYIIPLGGGPPGMGNFTDGSLHWLFILKNGNGHQIEIVALDMTKETFSLVPQPASLINPVMHLHVLEECLCVSYVFGEVGSSLQADLYMRKRNGAEEFTWTKLYSVTDSLLHHLLWFDTTQVLGYSKRRDKILLEIDGYIISYDVEDKSFSNVKIDKNTRWMCQILCLESLVSVGSRS